MSDRLLESWTRAPAIVDRRNAELALRKDPPPTPWAGRALSQALPILAIDADRQGRKGKDWLDGSGQRPRGGVRAQVDLTALTLDAWEVTDSITPTVIERGATRFAPLVCSLPSNANIVARPTQRWPSDEGESDGSIEASAKARVIVGDLLARLTLDHCGPRVLSAAARPEPLARRESMDQSSRMPAHRVRGVPAAIGSSRRPFNIGTQHERMIRLGSRARRATASLRFLTAYLGLGVKRQTTATSSAARRRSNSPRLTFHVTPVPRGHVQVPAVRRRPTVTDTRA
jgi:hypothetical protein